MMALDRYVYKVQLQIQTAPGVKLQRYQSVLEKHINIDSDSSRLQAMFENSIGKSSLDYRAKLGCNNYVPSLSMAMNKLHIISGSMISQRKPLSYRAQSNFKATPHNLLPTMSMTIARAMVFGSPAYQKYLGEYEAME